MRRSWNTSCGCCAPHGFTDVIVTLHYLGSTIENYFQSGEDFGLRISYTYENEPLGTAGSVALAREQLTEPFLVISGDALTDVDLTALTAAHEASASQATLLLARVPNPLEYGVVVTEDDGRIVRFQGETVVGRGAQRRRQHRHLHAGPGGVRPDPGGAAGRFLDGCLSRHADRRPAALRAHC